MEERLEGIDAFSETRETNIEQGNVGKELGFLEDEIYEDELCEETLPFNFEIAISVLEADEQDMETNFVEAVSEIGGGKHFPCNKCVKVCKSKGGLTRHVNAKHQDKHDTEESNDIPALTKDGLKSIVYRIKQNIINDGYWDKEVTSHIEKIGGNDSLFDAVLPIYTRFCVERNQDKFLIEFYELIPNSTTLFGCANQQLCSLVMISD